MSKFLIILIVFSFLPIYNLTYGSDIKVYVSPSTLFFSDGVAIRVDLGVDLKVGYSKFSSSDIINLSPEVNFIISQKENYSFSSFGINLLPSYDILIYSFEKKHNLYFRFGIGAGICYSATKLQNIEYYGFMLNIEPTIGLNYNFYENMWVGINFRYKISSELRNKISSIYSPGITIPFGMGF